MVMEASPSPQSVGREFVRQYYTLLNKAPAHLHRFYNNYSSFVHGGLDAPNRETLPVVGQKQIHNRIQQLNFRDCHAKISQVDAQATLGNGVVVQVTGELSNGGAPMRRFTQTFVLAAQAPKQYYVHNDIFRYQDIVVTDSEGSGGARSDGSEDESGYLGPGGAHYRRHSPPPLAHINGHPPVTPTSLPPGAPPPAPAPVPPSPVAAPPPPAELTPEPEPVPSPPPPATPVDQAPSPPPQPALPPEPKTYANLVKSGGSTTVARGEPAPPAPLEPRVRRAPTTTPPEPPSTRRYSDAQQVFLGNVPPHANEDQLKQLFTRFGPVADLRLHTKSGSHPNYGFVTFESASSAAACLAAAPLYFGADAVKLNVEEKKRRPPPRAPRAPPTRAPRR